MGACHEAGGGWSNEESPAPGFVIDHHCCLVSPTYHLTTERDFPEWNELTGKSVYPPVCTGAIFEEDHSSIVIYTSATDPTHERSAKLIAEFSEKDAEAFKKLSENYTKIYLPVLAEFIFNPPPLPGEPDVLERLWKDPNLFDPSWIVMSPLQVLRDIFETDALTAVLVRAN